MSADEGNDPRVQKTQLIGATAPYIDMHFPLITHMVTIGRGQDCDITLDEETISGNHTRLHFKDGQYELEDLNSTNGTYLNGKRISRAPLRTGDRIAVDTFEFIFQDMRDVPRTVVRAIDTPGATRIRPLKELTGSIDVQEAKEPVVNPIMPNRAQPLMRDENQIETLADIPALTPKLDGTDHSVTAPLPIFEPDPTKPETEPKPVVGSKPLYAPLPQKSGPKVAPVKSQPFAPKQETLEPDPIPHMQPKPPMRSFLKQEKPKHRASQIELKRQVLPQAQTQPTQRSTLFCLIQGLVVALLGGNVITTAALWFDQGWSASPLDALKQTMVIYPVLHTHLPWLQIEVSQGMLIAMVVVPSSVLIGSLWAQHVRNRPGLLAAIVFTIIYSACVFALYWIAVNKSGAIGDLVHQMPPNLLFVYQTGATLTLSLIGFALGRQGSD